MPKFIVVVDVAPRSGKTTFYLAKLVDKAVIYKHEITDPTNKDVYEIWSRYERLSDAQERVKELNGQCTVITT